MTDSRLNDISIIIEKSKRAGFFDDVSSNEVDFLEKRAKASYKADSSTFKVLEHMKVQLNNSPLSVMATPPTITVGLANAASAIAGAVNYPYNTNSVRIFGGVPRLRNSNGINSYQNGLVADTAANENPPFMVEFNFDGSAFEFGLFGGASASSVCYRIKVDSQYTNLTPQLGPGATGAKHLYKVDFGTRAIRRITLELSYLEFCGINTGPNDTIWAPTADKPIKALFLSDSYGEGTGGNPLLSWQYTASRLLGWSDVYSSCEGGTGYLNTGPAGRKKFFDRLATDVIPYSPDVLVIAGGINDTTSNNAAWTLGSGILEAEARRVYNEVASKLPNTKLFVINSWYPLSPVYQPIEDAHSAIMNAASGNGNVTALINPKGWVTGTGKVGTLTGSGNADLYTSSDGIHPTQAGHDYLGFRVASEISSYLAS